MTKFWEAFWPIFNNVLPFVIVGVLLYAIVRAGRQPLWAEAYRRLRGNVVAMIALGIISVYGVIALLDSVSWQDNKITRSQTVLDRIFKGIPQERTYSAPGGTMTFGEPHPQPLKGKHVLGTDGNGQDVMVQTLKGCRTAIIIGGFTSIIATPVALLFGMMAGY